MSSTQVPNLRIEALMRATIAANASRMHNTAVCESTVVVVADYPELDEASMYDSTFVDSDVSPAKLGLTQDDISSFKLDIDEDVQVDR